MEVAVLLQVLECYALNEAPPELVNDETQPDIAGMNKHMGAILGFRASCKRPCFPPLVGSNCSKK